MSEIFCDFGIFPESINFLYNIKGLAFIRVMIPHWFFSRRADQKSRNWLFWRPKVFLSKNVDVSAFAGELRSSLFSLNPKSQIRVRVLDRMSSFLWKKFWRNCWCRGASHNPFCQLKPKSPFSSEVKKFTHYTFCA